VPIKRNISFKTKPLIGTIGPQMNEKEPIFKGGTAKERNKRSFTRKKERKYLGTKVPHPSIKEQLFQKGMH